MLCQVSCSLFLFSLLSIFSSQSSASMVPLSVDLLTEGTTSHVIKTFNPRFSDFFCHQNEQARQNDRL